MNGKKYFCDLFEDQAYSRPKRILLLAMPNTRKTPSHQSPVGLGFIVPSANTRIEEEFVRLEGGLFRPHFTRIFSTDNSIEELEGMRSLLPEAAVLLSHAGVRCIAFGCTSGSFLRGIAYDRELVGLMTNASGLPCLTTSGCSVDALKTLGIRRPMIFTPYSKETSKRAASYFQEAGFDVVGLRWMDLKTADEMLSFSVNEFESWLKRELVPTTDGIFVSCTNFVTLDAAASIERAFGLPVITANGATIWRTLTEVGVPTHGLPLGRLSK